MIYNEANFPELPRSWASLTVDDSVDSAGNSNKKLKTKDALDHGRFPVIDQGQSDISGYSDDENLVVEASESSPVILFGDHTRLLKQISQPFVPGADGTKLFRAKSFWDTRFVYQMLRAVKLPDKGYARHFQYLRDSVLPLPPLNEQKRIADKLDAVLARGDACLDRLDRIPTILKRFRQSVLSAATSGKLTEEWRVEQGMNWSISTFQDLLAKEGGSIRRGPFGSAIKKSFFVRDGYKVYEQKNAIQDDPELGEYFIDDEKFHELEGFSIRGGDFIVSCAGTIGRISKLPMHARPGVINQALMRVRLDANVVGSSYFLLLFRSPDFQAQILEQTQGSAMQNMAAIKVIRQIPIRVPSLKEQTEIVRRVESLFAYADRLEARYAAARAQVEKITPATLAKAFRGELVPQDPNDEPASVLLARIATKNLDVTKNKSANKARR